MSWFKVDDRFHDHRKSRAARRSHPSKRRDVAVLGLWVCAGSWVGSTGTDGFVPLEVIEEWDDDAESLAERLVAAGLWWSTEQDGEPGYGFHDWDAMNPASDSLTAARAAVSGAVGNHIRWHVNQGRKSDDCDLCYPDLIGHRGDIAPESGATRPRLAPDIAPDSPPDSGCDSPPDSPPESQSDSHPISGGVASGIAPVPSRPVPTRPESAADPMADAEIETVDAEATDASAEIATAEPESSQQLIAEWIEHTDPRPPGRVIGQVSKEIKTMLDEGQPYRDVRAGLAAWASKGLHPSTLASVVHEQRTRKSNPASGSKQDRNLAHIDAAVQRWESAAS